MKKTTFVLLLAHFAVFLVAGELAILENLGFSSDGKYFMFGQHVMMTETGEAYAEIAVVDIPRNEFVPGGWKKNLWEVTMFPNQDSRGALYEILSDSLNLKERYGISHIEQGWLLYTQSLGDETMIDVGEGETPGLSFRDFRYGREYTMVLNQSTEENDSEVSASFFIDVAVTNPSGDFQSYTVGRPEYQRSGVQSYRIVRAWVGPEGRSLVIVIGKIKPDLSVRYMVETLVLD